MGGSQGGDSYAGADEDRAAGDGERLGEAVYDPPGQPFADVQPCAVEEDREFIAAEACGGVICAYARGDPLGDFGEQLVARSVAEGVVDGFEVVKVDEQDREFLPGCECGAPGLLESFQEQAAVR